jgi:hypothetical protein
MPAPSQVGVANGIMNWVVDLIELMVDAMPNRGIAGNDALTREGGPSACGVIQRRDLNQTPEGAGWERVISVFRPEP